MKLHGIVAIGKSGQVGLNGALPWHDAEDLAFFKKQTMGAVLVVGYKTKQTLPKLVGRTVVVDDTALEPEEFVAKVALDYPDKDIYIAGGAKTYGRYESVIGIWHISLIDYDGDADTYYHL